MITNFGLRIADFKKSTGIAGRLCASMLLLVLILAGCAGKGPILLDVAYQAPAMKPAPDVKAAVAVSPFRDDRDKPASVLGKRVISDGQKDEFVVQGTVAEIATTSLKKALVARGVTVTDAPAWDLTVDGLKGQGAPVLLGGEIKTLWLDSQAASYLNLNTHASVVVQLKVVAGDTVEKRIIRTIEVSSKLEQDLFYSKEKLQAMLSEALSTAIDRIFQDEELKKRLQ